MADRLGCGWQRLSAVNPRLVTLSTSGFGQSGPQAGRQAYAPIIHAESGLMSRQASLTGHAPSVPRAGDDTAAEILNEWTGQGSGLGPRSG